MSESLSKVLATRQDRMVASLGVFRSGFERCINGPHIRHYSTVVKAAVLVFIYLPAEFSFGYR